jgi:hypothetical protein
MGLVGQYLFNSSQFSYRAAFNQRECQLHSAGTFLAGGGLYYFHVRSDSSFKFHGNSDICSYQLGLNVGYAYNWAISSRWLANGSFSVGVNMGNKRVGSFFDRHIYVNPTFLSRCSLFYNRSSWSLGISFVVHIMSLIYSDDSNATLSTGRSELVYVHRINL